MTRLVDFVHAGPQRHGVRRFGELVARAVGRSTAVGEHCVSDSAPNPGHPLVRPMARVVHLQFSDHLIDPVAFADLVAGLREDGQDRRIVCTMHDCPGVGLDGGSRERDRARRYRDAALLVDIVIVCSHHERRALRDCGVVPEPLVIAHPVEKRVVPAPASGRRPRTVGVLGHVYPGKGHALVIDAVARLEPQPTVRFLGAVAPAHEPLLRDLLQGARRRGVPVEVTGWIEEQDLGALLVDTDVAVVAHAAVSASGSLATWLSAGRRPLVARNGYTTELAASAPGVIHLFDGCSPDGLREALRRALADPAVTYRSGTPTGYTEAEVAAAHIELYRVLS